jgi:hypothetical protein
MQHSKNKGPLIHPTNFNLQWTRSEKLLLGIAFDSAWRGKQLRRQQIRHSFADVIF